MQLMMRGTVTVFTRRTVVVFVILVVVHRCRTTIVVTMSTIRGMGAIFFIFIIECMWPVLEQRLQNQESQIQLKIRSIRCFYEENVRTMSEIVHKITYQ